MVRDPRSGLNRADREGRNRWSRLEHTGCGTDRHAVFRFPIDPAVSKTLEAETLASPRSHRLKRVKRHFRVVRTRGIPNIPKNLAIKARIIWNPSPNEDYLDPAPNSEGCLADP